VAGILADMQASIMVGGGKINTIRHSTARHPRNDWPCANRAEYAEKLRLAMIVKSFCQDW